MKSETKTCPTPLPWKQGEEAWSTIYAPAGFAVATCHDGVNHDIPHRANASLIATSVNFHQKLLLALQYTVIESECYCPEFSENRPCSYCHAVGVLNELGWRGDVTEVRVMLAKTKGQR